MDLLIAGCGFGYPTIRQTHGEARGGEGQPPEMAGQRWPV